MLENNLITGLLKRYDFCEITDHRKKNKKPYCGQKTFDNNLINTCGRVLCLY